jgi:hypothetical protein
VVVVGGCAYLCCIFVTSRYRCNLSFPVNYCVRFLSSWPTLLLVLLDYVARSDRKVSALKDVVVPDFDEEREERI